MRFPLALILALAAGSLSAQAPDECTTVKIAVDSVKHTVVITAGPFEIAKMMDMSGDMMHHHTESAMMRYQWPVDGDLSGLNVELYKADGSPVSIETVHHLVMYNFDRRQLIHESIERLFAWGQDTQQVDLPSGVGVPLPLGEHLGFLVAWHNDTGKDIHGAFVRITMPWTPPKRVKTVVFPWYLDVSNVNGSDNSYDVPAGRSTKTFDFTLPVSGRMIAAGGHMHPYGTNVKLVDGKSGKVLIKLNTTKSKNGTERSVERFIFGFHEDALPLEAHYPYRLVASYDNTSGAAIKKGGMSQLNGLFQPSDSLLWPKLDLNDPETVKDIKSLPADLGSCADQQMAKEMQMDPNMKMDEPAKTDTAKKPPRRSAEH
jgi:hypothetical protein